MYAAIDLRRRQAGSPDPQEQAQAEPQPRRSGRDSRTPSRKRNRSTSSALEKELVGPGPQEADQARHPLLRRSLDPDEPARTRFLHLSERGQASLRHVPPRGRRIRPHRNRMNPEGDL
ncbi:MAG: hypothetical protein MZU97_06965 [Bacillus subtilis]|nr:hypothetical protein [Bacillus subtilis]